MATQLYEMMPVTERYFYESKVKELEAEIGRLNSILEEVHIERRRTAQYADKLQVENKRLMEEIDAIHDRIME